MPTGYTCGAQDGEITTLRDFALVCAMAFGALIEMRDAPIPEKFEPSDYHKKELEKSRERLVFLSGLTAEQIEHEAQLWYEKGEEEHREYVKKTSIACSRYGKMIENVLEWNPPEDLSGLKSFMLEQLKRSLEFDCALPRPNAKRMTGNEWFIMELEETKDDIEYHTKEYVEEVERVKNRNQWLAMLFASLPSSEPVEKKGETSQ